MRSAPEKFCLVTPTFNESRPLLTVYSRARESARVADKIPNAHSGSGILLNPTVLRCYRVYALLAIVDRTKDSYAEVGLASETTLDPPLL